MLYDGIEKINEIQKIIHVTNPDILVFCIDFDGTLVKICKSPYGVTVSSQLYDFLVEIGEMKNTFLCIVTGRELTDIESRINIRKNIIYSGNHGFEIKSYYEDFKLDFLVENADKYIPLLEKALIQVKKIDINNLIIENKKFSISLHYRLLSDDETNFLKQSVKEIMSQNPDFKKFLHITKEKILEIRPRIAWNKGSACDYIVKALPKSDSLKLNILRVNIGDDVTDETMFSQDSSIVVNKTAMHINLINCVIGKKQSLANFYLNDYSDTPIFIRKIADIFTRHIY